MVTITPFQKMYDTKNNVIGHNFTCQTYKSQDLRPYNFVDFDLIILQTFLDMEAVNCLKNTLVITSKRTDDPSKVHMEDLDQSASTTYDLVICENVEAILSHAGTPNFRPHFGTLLHILTSANKIIMVDPFITNRTLSFAMNLRSNNKRTLFETNTFNPNAGTKVNMLGIAQCVAQNKKVKETFVCHVIEAIKAGKKVCVVSGTIDFKNELFAAVIQKKAVGVKGILTYDSDDNINTTWVDPKIRLVIYTACQEKYISFDVPNIFNTMYIYGTSMCPRMHARNLMQAHLCVKHLIDKTIHVAINTTVQPEGHVATKERHGNHM